MILKLFNSTIDTGIMNLLIVKLSLSLNLSLSVRDRDRADTIITLPHQTTHHQLFKDLRYKTFTQAWYIIGIVSSSPTHLHSENIGLIRVNKYPLSVLGLTNISLSLCEIFWWIINYYSKELLLLRILLRSLEVQCVKWGDESDE